MKSACRIQLAYTCITLLCAGCNNNTEVNDAYIEVEIIDDILDGNDLLDGNDAECPTMIIGYEIDIDRMCAEQDIELGCRDVTTFPYYLASYGCYYHSGMGINVFTWNSYYELAAYGWRECDAVLKNEFLSRGSEYYLCE